MIELPDIPENPEFDDREDRVGVLLYNALKEELGLRHDPSVPDLLSIVGDISRGTSLAQVELDGVRWGMARAFDTPEHVFSLALEEAAQMYEDHLLRRLFRARATGTYMYVLDAWQKKLEEHTDS